MKRFTSIAIAALAAALGFTSVASADASFYGRVTAGAVHVDNDAPDDDGSWDFGSNKPGLATRVGFRGSQDLGNGMEAGFQIERNVTGTGLAKRHNLVYLSGPWGKLTMGNQNNPYMKARNWDQTYFYGGNWGHGSSYRHEGINYSNNIGPISLNIMAMASSGGGTNDGKNGVDGWILHAGYDFGVAAVNVAHQSNETENPAGRNNTAIGINGSVGALDWYLAHNSSELSAKAVGAADHDVSSTGGFLGFNMSDKDTFYAYHVTHSADIATSGLGEDYTETILGYSRDMGPGLRFIGEYAAHDQDLDGANGDNTSRLALAIRYVF